MRITVQTIVDAPVERIWAAYTTPSDIAQWNAASNDWHTKHASVDLRVGGAFCSRMEAKDGSARFDFTGTFTKVERHRCIEYWFGDRLATITFGAVNNGVLVRVTFDADGVHSIEQQRQGWQAILDSFNRYVMARS